MSDPLRRYLAAQQDLGGDELFFDEAVTVPAKRSKRTTSAAAEPKAEPTMPRAPMPTPAPAPTPQMAAPVRAKTIDTGDDAVGWRKGAPPIPGPGFAVHPPVLAGVPRWESLGEIAEVVSACVKCPLCQGRTKTVPGEGNPRATLMVVGEGPGENEDLSGRPFVGRAGELLDKILESIETPRETVFIANVVKCRPPRNRAPLPDERDTCMPYLRRQIELVRPKVLLALGGTAAEALLGMKRPLGDLRLKVHRWSDIPLVVTYHPAALLRNPNWKRPAWDDVRIARQLLDLDD